MFLKALTIKGFKSFADSAHLELEPGITVVVGPNGSGKSNVVDAMAWVMGAQAPKIIRSQKMDDVIFAGTSKKKALGRAEVSLTIDNSEGDLPIEFSEVTITRVLFRNGDSDYSINGVSCRLLDIQELLSDSGVGKQQHIIVSQGRIDAVLNSSPQDRRSIIEEAAGVLKYRKRRERAERRLASTAEDLHRLQDLVREVKRQLKPLEKQAEAALKHGSLVSELQVLKVHLAGRRLQALQGQLATNKASRSDNATKEDEIQKTLATLDASVLADEAELSALGGSDIVEIVSRVSSLQERVKGQRNVVNERRLRLQGELEAAVDQGLVANLEAESSRITAELAIVSAELDAIKPEFSELEIAEAALVSNQLSFDEQWGHSLEEKAPAKAAEVRAQIDALSAASKRSEKELERVAQQLSSHSKRQAENQERVQKNKAELQELETAIPDLEKQSSAAVESFVEGEKAVEVAREKRRDADSEQSRWQAREDALSQALAEARAQAGADALAQTDGVLGTLLDLVDIDQGWEAAIEAAVGEALRAVVIENSDKAAASLEVLLDKDLASAVLPLSEGSAGSEAAQVLSELRSHVRPLRQDVASLLDVLLTNVHFVDGDWRCGYEAACKDATATFVTKEGARFAPTGWSIGAASGSGATGAALEEAVEKAAKAAIASETAKQMETDCSVALSDLRGKRRATESALQQAKQRQRRATEIVDSVTAELVKSADATTVLEEQQKDIFSLKQRDAETIKSLMVQLPQFESQEKDFESKAAALASTRVELDDQAKTVASQRTELQVRTAALEQRQASLVKRQGETEAKLVSMVSKRDEARIRRERIEGVIAQVDVLENTLLEKSTTLQSWFTTLKAEQDAQSAAAQQVSQKLAASRRQRQDCEKELGELRERQTRLEISHTENRVKLETLTEALRRELDTDPEIAMTTQCPELEVGVAPEARVRDLERELKIIGTVNPLAVEEFQELQERHEFLGGQLDDIKSARRDLTTLIRSVDEEIVSVFSAAYADVSENFTALFTSLFPGGKGGVQLTNADDILNCGIEIEAKPSGKNVKKLSLLSGGERSLVALAFLFAVFRSRPSPFYVMDEVEAALDDMNLSRFLSLIEEFRKEAQLIVVSHQKRTMEAADVLYGVSMSPGGSSKVVTEKVAENKDLAA